jgi:hypothetical protein
MALSGEYSDTLRALGRFLNDVRACQIGIVEREDDILLTWSAESGYRYERRLQITELQAMRMTARIFRGLGGPSPRFTIGEMLRAVGTIMDEMGPSSIAITEAADGFRVSARVGEERLIKVFAYSDLVARAQQYHRARSALVPEPPNS